MSVRAPHSEARLHELAELPDRLPHRQREDARGAFDDGDAVTAETLVEAGLVRDTTIPVKILGEGELSKKLERHRREVLGLRPV